MNLRHVRFDDKGKYVMRLMAKLEAAEQPISKQKPTCPAASVHEWCPTQQEDGKEGIIAATN